MSGAAGLVVLNNLNHLGHVGDQNSVLVGYLIGIALILTWFTVAFIKNIIKTLWYKYKNIIKTLWYKYKSSSYYKNRMAYKNLERENILQLYKIGYPIKQIAKLHCVNELTVRKYLKLVPEE